VPLPLLIFHFFVACSENLPASVASSSKLGVVAWAAVDLVHLTAKLFIHQGQLAFVTQEAFFMPVFILIRQVLGIDADDDITVLAGIGEDCLVTLNAVGMVILQDIALTREALIALPAAEVPRVPVLRHRLGVLATENELVTCRTTGLQLFCVVPTTMNGILPYAIN